MTAPETSFTVPAFVRELARSWHKLSMYQEGHPERANVAARVQAIAVGLVAPTGGLALGITRDAVLGGEERVEGGPVKKFAEALFDRSVAVVRFEEGLTAKDLELFLGLLPRWRATENETPLWDQAVAKGLERIKIEASDFSGLITTDEVEDSPRRRAQSEHGILEEMLQRLIRDERLGQLGGVSEADLAGGEDPLAEIVGVVHRLMERHGLDPAQAVRGAPASTLDALEALSGALGGAMSSGLSQGGDKEKRLAAARYVGDLLNALPDALRDGVLDSALRDLSTADAGAEGLEDLSRSLSAAQMVTSLRRLRSEEVTFSPRMMGLVEDLVLDAAAEISVGTAAEDDDRFTEGLREVFASDDVDRILPSQARMDRIALELRSSPPRPVSSAELEPRLESLTDRRLTVQLAQTLLELLQRPIFDEEQLESLANRMERIVQSLLTSGQLRTGVRIVQALQGLSHDETQGAAIRYGADGCLERLRGEDTIAALIEALAELPEDSMPLIHELIELLGERVIEQLLLALCEERDLGRRRHTFDLLVTLGTKVAPSALGLLGDERWYVVRNMLSLLRQVGHQMSLDTLQQVMGHGDERVRLEGVKALANVDGSVPGSLLARLLEDPDPKVAESAATAIGLQRLAEGRDPLIEILKRNDPLARATGLRLKALAALGELGDPSVLEEIAHFFRAWFATVTADERRAAFSSLAGYPVDQRRVWLKKGLKSPDRETRAICQRLAKAAE